MSSVPLIIGAVALVVAVVVGFVIQARDGKLRESSSDVDPDLRVLLTEISFEGPAVIHFSATWCAPCKAVRRVVASVTGELADAAHPPQDLEVDIDENPRLAAQLHVLSLPTTFIFDRDARQRFRSAGVPNAADLRTALAPLTN